MVKQKGYRYRLKPTTKQRQYLNQAFGCARKLYNFYVDDLYRQLEARGYESGRIDNVSVKEASAVKQLFPYMKDVDSLAFANVKQNFTKAISQFNNKHGSTYKKRSRKWVKTKGHVLTFSDPEGPKGLYQDTETENADTYCHASCSDSRFGDQVCDHQHGYSGKL